MVSYVEPQQVAKMMVGEKRMNGNSVGIECERYIKNTSSLVTFPIQARCDIQVVGTCFHFIPLSPLTSFVLYM